MTTKGVGVYKHDSTKLKMTFGPADAPKPLFLEIRVNTEASYDVSSKVIGMQVCRPSVKNERSIVEWDKETRTATINIQLRVRLIRQREHGWEFHDDAGSGSRGKSHHLSRFCFGARLLRNYRDPAEMVDPEEASPDSASEPEDELALCQIPVWSKGNCPARKR
jgi:hypothetical protein